VVRESLVVSPGAVGLQDIGMFLRQPDLSSAHAPLVKAVYNDRFYPPEGLSNEYVCPLICQRLHVAETPLESTVFGVFILPVDNVE
jgi:hypothetical protein